MGSGYYTAGDWSKLRKSRSLDSSATSTQIFKANKMNPKFDPKFVDKREARDSEGHPESTPIAIGVDVTGSMGYLSTQIIKESLNDLMQELYTKDFVKDPQLLFAAIGDAVVDSAPLQVTQFESDIRIAEQLLDLWLENSGGDLPEDYELMWYFLARHTDIDSFNKRGKKGYCFTIGDAACHTALTERSIKRIFDDDVRGDIKTVDLAKEASLKYHLFHIMIGNKQDSWLEFIPGRVLFIQKSEVKYLPQVIVSTIQLSQGKAMNEVLEQWGDLERPVVSRAIENLVLPTSGGSIEF